MPIHDYTCSACGHLTEVLHGINDHGPKFCPECGAEDTMTKGFAPPAIVFKGSGWAKKDRAATASKAKSDSDGSGDKAGGDKAGDDKPKDGESPAKDKAAAPGASDGSKSSGSSTGPSSGGSSSAGSAAASD